MSQNELLVFVDEAGRPTGEVGPKLASHTANTKLHLAFSCYIVRPSDNKLLVTQRALGKKVWPGVWTNSVCGHPAPGEVVEDAIRRRAMFELGIDTLQNISCALSNYRYITPLYNGIIENEFCPVFIANADGPIRPNPAEVAAYRWLSWSNYGHMLNTKPNEVSYWAKDQYRYLKDRKEFG